MPGVFEKQQGHHDIWNTLQDGKREACEASLCRALQTVLRKLAFTLGEMGNHSFRYYVSVKLGGGLCAGCNGQNTTNNRELQYSRHEIMVTSILW